ncbi:hypothetical protein P7C70_g6437, partial [Phenoliferia sp. Uapishka_3]
MKTIQERHWEAATVKEIVALKMLKNWNKVKENTLPEGAVAINSKFVYHRKGDRQQEARDFQDTLAPVVKFTSLRLLSSLAAREEYHIHQANINSAFTQAMLLEDQPVYLKLPEGMRELEEYIGFYLKLNNTLHGLKQAAHL